MEKSATEAEMIEHCKKYPCMYCPLSKRCSMHEKLEKFHETLLKEIEEM
jgi:hypothetical protein